MSLEFSIQKENAPRRRAADIRHARRQVHDRSFIASMVGLGLIALAAAVYQEQARLLVERLTAGL